MRSQCQFTVKRPPKCAVRSVKTLHALESVTNVVVGYLINVVLVYTLLHALGYEIRLVENASISLVIACVSFARGYYIRELFHSRGGKWV